MNWHKKVFYYTLFALTALPCVAVGEETLGRLFFTPEQRIRLEQLESNPEVETKAIISNKILVNGILQRHGGSRVVWINGVPQSQKSANGILAERDIAPDSVPVKIPGTGNSIRLKVGQSIDLDSSMVVRNVSFAREINPDATMSTDAGENAQDSLLSVQQFTQKTGKRSIPPNEKTD